MRKDKVAETLTQSSNEKARPVGKEELQTKCKREVHRQSDKYCSSHHRHVILRKRQRTLHLRKGSEVHSVGKLEHAKKDQVKNYTGPFRHPIPEVHQRRFFIGIPRHYLRTLHSTFIPDESLAINSGSLSAVKAILTGIRCSILTKLPVALSGAEREY